MAQDLNNFWNWLSKGVEHVPTLGTRDGRNNRLFISAVTVDNNLRITAGNGTVQPLISRNTVEKYILDYKSDTNQIIKTNKRYVVALYLRFLDPR